MNDAKLRTMTEADLPLVLSWRNADNVRMNMYTHHVISEDEHRAWWNRQRENPASRLLVCEVEGTPVGVVTFTGYTGKDGVSSWAFYSGDTSRRGIGPIMERLALHYAFEELEVRRLECEVLSFNLPVVRFHRKHGFQVEGVLRDAYERDGKCHDIYKLSLLRREWLKRVRPELEQRQSGSGRKDATGKVFTKTVLLDAAMVKRFAEAVGDHNPIHLDDQAARQAGFPGAIAHGMLSGGLFSAVLANDFPGPGTVYLRQSLNFLAPVPVGARVTVIFRVMSHFGRRLGLETAIEMDGKPCVTGEAEVLAPENF